MLFYRSKYKDENFKFRSYILTSLSRNNIKLSQYTDLFCDKLIKENWSIPLDDYECDRQITLMYEEFIKQNYNNLNEH